MRTAARRTLVGVGLFIAMLLALPFVVPLDDFTPELERAASRRLHQPVSIPELRLRILPTPRLVARKITVGRNNEMFIGELEIIADAFSLLSETPSIRLVHAGKVELTEAAFSIPRGMPKRRAGKAIPVERVLLTEVNLRDSVFRLGEFDLDLVLGEAFRVEQATVQTRDGTMTLVFQPHAEKPTAVSLRAARWTLPMAWPFVFEALAGEASLAGEELELSKIEGTLYGGNVAASARVDWSRQQWHVSGKAALSGVDLARLQQALGKPPKLSGRLNGDAVFSARALKAGELRDALELQGPFEVIGGAYHGVDLSKAGDITGNATVEDATPFKELKGKLEVSGGRTRINELCVRSPKLVAGGNIEIASDAALSGRLDIAVAKTSGFVGVPVSLGGTTSQPSLVPTKGYIIGAAIGTMVLPGIGTSIGSALGGRINSTSDCK